MLNVLILFAGTASCLTFYQNSTTTSKATSTTVPFGAYIVQGIAGDTTASTSSTVSRSSQSQILSNNGSSSTLITTSTLSNVSYGQLETSTPVSIYSGDYFTTSSPGTLFSSATQCWSDVITWSSRRIDWWNSQVAAPHSWPIAYSTITYFHTYNWTSTSYPQVVSTYKLCDGSPRADILPYTTSGMQVDAGSTWTSSSFVTPTFTPQPCTPSFEECYVWYKDSRAYELNEQVLLHNCGYPVRGADPGTLDVCEFGLEGGVQLIYFPAQTAANDSLCAANRSTITATPTASGPNVLTTLGHTFTSGSAYLSIKSLWAYNDAFKFNVGPNYTDLILTLASTDISTKCGDSAAGVYTPMNYGDLNWPVPASAYRCQDRCSSTVLDPGSSYPPECSTIWSDVNPLLAIPTAVRSMDPAWASCNLDFDQRIGYWFDPPIALQPKSQAASITQTPDPAVTTPAVPQSAPTSPTPTSTSRATMTQGPSRSPSSTRAAVETGTFVPADGPAESVLPEADTTIGGLGSSSSELAVPSSAEHDPSSASAAGGASSPVVESGAVLTAVASSDEPSSTSLPKDAPTEAGDLPPSTSQSAVVSAAAIGTRSQSAAGSTVVVPAQPGVAFTAPDPTPDPQTTKSSSSPPAAQVSAAQTPPGSSPPDTTPSFSFDPTPTTQDGAIITIASHAVTVVQSSGHLVIGTSIVPAGEGATIGGQTIVQSSGVIIVGSSSVAVSHLPEFSSAAGPPISTIAAGSIAFTASAVSEQTGAVVIAGQTVSVGGPAATISGHAITQGSSGLAIISGEHTQPLSAVEAPTPSVLQVNSFTITASPASGDPNVVQVGTNVLSAGGAAATVSGKIITQGSSGLVLLPGSSLQPTVLQQGSLTITASPIGGNPNVVAVDGHTLSAGGAAATISGKIISQGSSALLLLPSGAATTPGPQPTVLQDGSSFTVTASPVGGNPNVVAVDGHTLSQGGPAATISGKIISQGSSALIVLPAPHTTASGPQPTVLQDGSFTVTASPVGGNPNVVDVDGHTLSAGGAAATVSGKIISQDSSALVVLPAPATTSLPSVVVQTTSTPATYTPGVRTGSNPEATTSTRSAASRAEVWSVVSVLVGVLWLLWS